ncbi:DUF4031 domain-containing protein [soil metagenome]|nr:DUF4031 domain-containing protein [Euzebyaceae bacterium]
MTVLVDPLRPYPRARLPSALWCHMVSDSGLDELHELAGVIGLRRAWFQGDHYDLTPGGRAAAVAAGAVEVSSREVVRRMIGADGSPGRVRPRRAGGG